MKSIFVVSRRRVLVGLGAVATASVLPFGMRVLADDAPVTTLETVDGLFCVYVDRGSGKVVAVKTFAEVNPEVASGKKAKTPYRAPTRNVYIGTAGTVFTQDIARFGLVDFAKRNANAGWFSGLKDSYLPDEYTHHFLLTLADRALAGEELGGWALGAATGAQKESALKTLHRVHAGWNGKRITDDPERMAEATRFYTGREVLRPMLYLGTAPQVGDLAMIGALGIRVAALGAPQLALADSGRVTGGVAVEGDAAANAVSVAAEGASESIGAVSASVGTAAGVGASSGGASDTGGGAESSGESSGSGGSSGGGGASGGPSGGGGE